MTVDLPPLSMQSSSLIGFEKSNAGNNKNKYSDMMKKFAAPDHDWKANQLINTVQLNVKNKGIYAKMPARVGFITMSEKDAVKHSNPREEGNITGIQVDDKGEIDYIIEHNRDEDVGDSEESKSQPVIKNFQKHFFSSI